MLILLTQVTGGVLIGDVLGLILTRLAGHRMTTRQLTLTILASLILGLILSLIGFTIQSI